MKNLSLFCLLLTCIGFQSCKKDQKSDDAKDQTEAPLSVSCYKALYEKDTVELKINTLKDGKITGDMVMKIFTMPKKVGEITGEFHGDTLFVDYSFSEGKDEKKIFKNPLAMLKKGDTLILGNGKIETYLGRSYFSKGLPIDFENVKYKFLTVDCVDK
ncbi:hypothetical protein AAGV33_15360 [Flavobacterium sp. FBOR7N2.3]|uniref:Lipoprotein n=1 Tax=Flavobacterium magnesitis TaxID=3138077 RepID=A0ABV4TNR4_9FLAO